MSSTSDYVADYREALRAIHLEREEKRRARCRAAYYKRKALQPTKSRICMDDKALELKLAFTKPPSLARLIFAVYLLDDTFRTEDGFHYLHLQERSVSIDGIIETYAFLRETRIFKEAALKKYITRNALCVGVGNMEGLDDT